MIINVWWFHDSNLDQFGALINLISLLFHLLNRTELIYCGKRQRLESDLIDFEHIDGKIIFINLGKAFEIFDRALRRLSWRQCRQNGISSADFQSSPEFPDRLDQPRPNLKTHPAGFLSVDEGSAGRDYPARVSIFFAYPVMDPSMNKTKMFRVYLF